MNVMMQLLTSFPSHLVFWPLLGVVVILCLPSQKENWLKNIALLVCGVEVLFSTQLALYFQNTGVFDQYLLDIPWIKSLNVHYLLALDGVSLTLVWLTSLLLFLGLVGTYFVSFKNLKLYLVCLLVLLSGMMGVFLAVDLFLFFVFWEMILIPMYFLIGIWGGEQRGYASIKFVIYTMVGSVFMLLGLMYLYFKGGNTFNLLHLYSEDMFFLSFKEQMWLFAAFGIAFAIKVPLFWFHTWLPDAHVQAPTLGSVLLAGILLKMGVYGFFRITFGLFPQAVYFLQPYLMTLSVVGVVYGALVAMAQTDIKKLIAYSSVSHMGVVMLGLFSLNQTAMTGALFQMLSHGVSTGALFLLIGMLYERTHTRQMSDYSGLAKQMPVFSVLFFIVLLSSIAVPLTNGFVGEFLILMGSYSVNAPLTVVAGLSVILGAVYMLTLFQNVFLGPVAEKTPYKTPHDLKFNEVLALVPLLILIFWMGLMPGAFLKKLERPSETILLKMSELKTVTSVVSSTGRTNAL